MPFSLTIILGTTCLGKQIQLPFSSSARNFLYICPQWAGSSAMEIPNSRRCSQKVEKIASRVRGWCTSSHVSMIAVQLRRWV